MKTILFVCTGNTCRSPMAAALCNLLLERRGENGIRAESAGLAAAAGEPAAANAVRAAAEAGAELSAHRARQVTPELVARSAAVYAMSPAHVALLQSAFPGAAGKTALLGAGIPDPYGGDLAAYRRCRDAIAAALRELPELNM